MRRFARGVFTGVSALSLLACVIVCLLWVDASAFTRSRQIWFAGQPPTNYLGTKPGIFMWYWGDLTPRPLLSNGFRDWSVPGLLVRRVIGPVRGYRVWIRPWLAAAATGLLPACWAAGQLRHRLSRRARRRSEGLCPQCGYDLRASPDRCPECGATPAK